MALRADGHADVAWRTVLGRRCWSPGGLQQAIRAAVGDLPDADPRGVVIGQPRTIGAEAQGAAPRSDQWLARRRVPEPGRPIPARRDQEVLRRVECDGDDRRVMALQDGPRPVRGDVPQMGLTIITGRWKRGVVPAPSQTPYPPRKRQ